jgi:predicted nuclease of restriction endonuclease-like (RecB) superfamily
MRNIPQDYKSTLKLLKEGILQSRYEATKAVNQNLLQLYLYVGLILIERSKDAQWGDKVLEKLSADLQQELPGLRGFSTQNIKKMRVFVNAWKDFFSLENQDNPNYLLIGSPLANQLNKTSSALPNQIEEIGSPLVNPLPENFWNIGFTHHYLIISKTESLKERSFYINRCAAHAWSKRTLEYHLKSDLYHQQDMANTNFATTLPANQVELATQQFKDEYLLDYINIEESEDERALENEIVLNIKNFMMSLGTGFTFIGNQHRVIVGGQEFFIDLLFYNRQIQALVAIELKTGKFKPEYAGQLNFYLNVLDDTMKLPHEMQSVGIVLCKEKNNTVVEYAMGNINKPMGVATYKTANELPDAYKQILPSQVELRKLLNE